MLSAITASDYPNAIKVPEGYEIIQPGTRVRVRPLRYYLHTGQGKACCLDLSDTGYIECRDVILLGQSRLICSPGYMNNTDDSEYCHGESYVETDQGVAYLP